MGKNNYKIDSDDEKSISNDNSYYKNVLLIGSPNVGKSLTFNKLTGMTAMVSNYPGPQWISMRVISPMITRQSI